MASALLGIAKPLVGAVAGGLFGSRGSRTSQRTQQNFTRTTKGKSELDAMFKNMMLPVEDPYMQSFRQGLLPLMAQEFTRIQKPIYGEGEIAKQLQGIQGQFVNASDLILNKLASVGALNSGRTAQALTDIGMKEAGAQAKFLSGLPMQEEITRRSGLNKMFALMSNLTGRAPVGQIGSGSQQQKKTSEKTTQQVGTADTTATENNGGFWDNFVGNMAKGIGMGEFDPIFDTMRNLVFKDNGTQSAGTDYSEE